MAEQHDAEHLQGAGASTEDQASPPRMRRRRALQTAAILLGGTAAGSAGAVGVEEFMQSHPAPPARVSPLVQGGAIGSPTKIIWRGDPTKRRVALTFDDGPDPRWTPMALDILEKHGAKGTFFMLGSLVAQHPEIAKAVAEAGHEIGSHNWDHRHMSVQPAEELADSLARTHRQIVTATGTTPRLMRPPYGQFDAATAWAIACMNYSITLWSHRMTADAPWDRAKENVATATNGMIMLSHDGRGTPTAEQMHAADWMIGQMRQQGWEFVPVSGLLQ